MKIRIINISTFVIGIWLILVMVGALNVARKVTVQPGDFPVLLAITAKVYLPILIGVLVGFLFTEWLSARNVKKAKSSEVESGFCANCAAEIRLVAIERTEVTDERRARQGFCDKCRTGVFVLGR